MQKQFSKRGKPLTKTQKAALRQKRRKSRAREGHNVKAKLVKVEYTPKRFCPNELNGNLAGIV
jgi:hypothetical protein